MIITPFIVVIIGGRMSDEEVDSVAMAECGACRAVIPIDSEACPECDTKFSGISEDALGECGGCQALVPLDSTRCPECGVLFVADDVVDILRQWVADTGINIRKLFDRFDENSDGTIDSSELKQGLLSLNLADLPPSQVDRLVAEIDADGNGLIDLDEFDAILNGDEVEPLSDASSEPEEQENETATQNDDESDDEGDDEDVVEIDSDADQSDDEENIESEDDVISSDIDDEEFDLEDVEDADEDDDASYVGDSSDEGDGEEVDDEATEEPEDEEPDGHPLAALAAMMDEHDISAQRMFNELDVDGNGTISLAELRSTLSEKYGDVLDIEDVDAIMEAVDDDEDGLIDITEFYDSMESLDDHEEAVIAHQAEKEFPTAWQKRMMSKSWNDAVWPILHVGFGILIALVLVNALFGPVDGSGGNVAYVPNDSGLIPGDGLSEGDIYKCDEKYQDGGCPNSLTIMGGPESKFSMPKGFYLDGILLLMLSTIGLIGSLFLHLVKAPEWRARAKAMKEFEEDKADASNESEEAAEENLDEKADDEVEEEEDEADGSDFEEDGDEEFEDDAEEVEDDEEDAIDIGSHIGLVFDDEEVFGVIVEFDDEEETVTIEEDGTGDLVTGYQEDMFIE